MPVEIFRKMAQVALKSMEKHFVTRARDPSGDKSSPCRRPLMEVARLSSLSQEEPLKLRGESNNILVELKTSFLQ